MEGCSAFGVHRIQVKERGEWTTGHQDYCDVHFAEFMHNGLIDVVRDDR